MTTTQNITNNRDTWVQNTAHALRDYRLNDKRLSPSDLVRRTTLITIWPHSYGVGYHGLDFCDDRGEIIWQINKATTMAEIREVIADVVQELAGLVLMCDV